MRIRNKKYIFIIVLLIILLFITGTYTFLHYHFNYSSHKWFRESINDGAYEIVGKNIGDTIFDGGSQVQISIYSHTKHMVTFRTTIKSQGKELTDDNYDIYYDEEYIKIKLIDSDNQSSVSYCFLLDDFN